MQLKVAAAGRRKKERKTLSTSSSSSPNPNQAFVEEAADYDAALADNARARFRVRGPTAAARAILAAKATAAATGAAGAVGAANLQQQQQLRGTHVVAASLLTLQRALAGIMGALVADFGVDPAAKGEARRLWGLAVAAARVFGGDDDDDENGNGGESFSVASRAEARAEAWRDAPSGGGKSGPEAVSSLAFSAGSELGRRGLGPRCLLSLALLASWRAASSSSSPPVTPLDLVRGAARGAIPFLDLSPFAAAASAAAAAAAAAANDGGSAPSPLSLPPRLASLPLISPRLLRPRSLPGPDRVAARAARLARVLLAAENGASSSSSFPSSHTPSPLLPALPNPAALLSRWLSEMGAPAQLAVVGDELYRLLAPAALRSVAAASGRKRTPGSKKKRTTKKRGGSGSESDSEDSSSRSDSSSDDDEEEEEEDSEADDERDGGGGEGGPKRRRGRRRQQPSLLLPPGLTDDSRLDPVRAVAASLLLSLKLCYGLGGPTTAAKGGMDMRGFGEGLPGLPAAPRAEKGEEEDDDEESDGEQEEEAEDENASSVARGWRRWASAVVEASGKPPLPVAVPELGEESDRYVAGLSRGVFCGGGGGKGGELEAALSARAAAAAAVEARREEEERQPLPPPPAAAAAPRRRGKRKKKEESSKKGGEESAPLWKPGQPWLCARWQPAGAVEAAAAAFAAANAAATAPVPSSSLSLSPSRPSDFALPASYACVLAAVSAHCGYVPRALHETAAALEEELSRERKR